MRVCVPAPTAHATGTTVAWWLVHGTPPRANTSVIDTERAEVRGGRPSSPLRVPRSRGLPRLRPGVGADANRAICQKGELACQKVDCL